MKCSNQLVPRVERVCTLHRFGQHAIGGTATRPRGKKEGRREVSRASLRNFTFIPMTICRCGAVVVALLFVIGGAYVRADQATRILGTQDPRYLHAKPSFFPPVPPDDDDTQNQTALSSPKWNTSDFVGAEYTPWRAGSQLWWHNYSDYREEVVAEVASMQSVFGFTAVRVFLHDIGTCTTQIKPTATETRRPTNAQTHNHGPRPLCYCQLEQKHL